MIDKVNTALDGITQVMVPGRFAVDYIPLLEHVPAWFPGAGFKRNAKKWKICRRVFPEALASSWI